MMCTHKSSRDPTPGLRSTPQREGAPNQVAWQRGLREAVQWPVGAEGQHRPGLLLAVGASPGSKLQT